MAAPVSALLSVFVFDILIFFVGCGGGSTTPTPSPSPTPTLTPSTPNEWTWMSGSSSTNAAGVYGSLGVASTSNVPGARAGAVGWTDLNGNLWLFGGNGGQTPGNGGQNGTSDLNDLWEYNPTSGTWTWQGGSIPYSAQQSYGALGVASAAAVPGPLYSPAGWTDSSGNLWLFGGSLSHTSGSVSYFNDLWEFNPTNREWTWVNGSASEPNSGGVYGTLGTASTDNMPGGRDLALSWTDSSGNFWLFGGEESYTGCCTTFNDLWEFKPAERTWTWVSGTNRTNVAGSYGAKGLASTSNVPGARYGSSGWIDSKGNLWLYGGQSPASRECDMADLWEFNPATNEWTWVAGSNSAGQTQPPVYGTQGTPSAQNTPGSRCQAISWMDTSDNLWLFGGDGDSSDLWKFNPNTNQWVWAGGSTTTSMNGTRGNYGTMGVPSPTNVLPGRDRAVGWTDKSGNFWLFGGAASGQFYNDLWRYQP